MSEHLHPKVSELVRDLGVVLIKKALLATGQFTAHPKEPIKLFYKDAVELDLLPFGGIENG